MPQDAPIVPKPTDQPSRKDQRDHRRHHQRDNVNPRCCGTSSSDSLIEDWQVIDEQKHDHPRQEGKHADGVDRYALEDFKRQEGFRSLKVLEDDEARKEHASKDEALPRYSDELSPGERAIMTYYDHSWIVP